jgi:hypothetical protein
MIHQRYYLYLKAKRSQVPMAHVSGVILPTWEAEIRRIEVQDQPRQRVHETSISKITKAKWTGGVAQAVRGSKP